MQPLDLAGRKIGPGQPCFVIAEAGVNHNGDTALAERLVDAAADAGADAVKFQTFRAQELATSRAPKAEYQKAGGGDESQLEMLQRLELSPAAHETLVLRCRRRNILFLSSPFEEQSADLLERLGVPAFKIASGELTNLPFLDYVAKKGKPLLLSTGMSTLKEVETAVSSIRAAGRGGLALLHCVSNYPADPAHANLRTMRTMEQTFEVPVGFSDHTLGNEVALAAVALGASIIEKHLTLDCSMPGPDHRSSADPAAFAALVRGIRKVESAIGHGRKEPAPDEAATAAVARKSWVALEDIPAGATLREGMIARRRPGTGLAPSEAAQVLGRRAKRPIPAGTPLSREMFE